jgi:DNA-binding transcriptional MerR regulator
MRDVQIDADEVARQLGIRVRTVHDWAQRGLLGPVVKESPRRLRFSAAAVAAVAAQRAKAREAAP